MTESSASIPEGAALPRLALAFWPQGRARLCQLAAVCARLPAEEGRGRRGAVRPAVLSRAAAGCGTLVVFASAGAPDIAPRPCR